VSIIDENSFYLDDGSGAPIRVTAPGYTGVQTGDCISVRGTLGAGSKPPVLTVRPEQVVRY
jgi:hypothetical protein